MKQYLKALRQYADFKGRADRSEFWLFVLFNFIFLIAYTIVVVLLTFLFAEVFNLFSNAEDIPQFIIRLMAIFYCFVLIPGLAVSIRRLHDVNKSGWMLLLNLIPLIGSIWLFILLITPGKNEGNNYGTDPKEMRKLPEKINLKDIALILLLVFSLFSIFLSVVEEIEMVSRGFYENSMMTLKKYVISHVYFFRYIALVIMSIALWRKNNYTKTAAVSLILAFGFILIGMIYEAIFVQFLFVQFAWIIIPLTIMVFAFFLFQKGETSGAGVYSLLFGSVCWIGIYIYGFMTTLKFMNEHDHSVSPNFLIGQLSIMIPVALLLYAISMLKKRGGG